MLAEWLACQVEQECHLGSLLRRDEIDALIEELGEMHRSYYGMLFVRVWMVQDSKSASEHRFDQTRVLKLEPRLGHCHLLRELEESAGILRWSCD